MITSLICTVKKLAWLEMATFKTGCHIVLTKNDMAGQGYTVTLEGSYKQVRDFLVLAAQEDALY